MIMKKAAAQMWWIIIGAVIALVVLVVLMVIFTGRTTILERGLSECEGKAGICVSDLNCPQNTLKTTAFSCKGNLLCCVGSPKDYEKFGGQEDCMELVVDSTGKSWCK